MQYTKKYQKTFWMKQTYTATFITTFWTVQSPTTEKFELAKEPTKTFRYQKNSFLRFKITAAIYSQGKSQQFQKGSRVCTRHFG